MLLPFLTVEKSLRNAARRGLKVRVWPFPRAKMLRKRQLSWENASRGREGAGGCARGPGGSANRRKNAQAACLARKQETTRIAACTTLPV